MAGPGSELGSSFFLFATFDKDGDDWISASELRLCMTSALDEEVSAEDTEALVASVDADGDRLLHGDEFARLVVHADGVGEEEERHRGLREAFALYEMEGEGCITPTSLKRMLSRLGAHQEIHDYRAMICRFDLDGDGVLAAAATPPTRHAVFIFRFELADGGHCEEREQQQWREA